MERFNIGRRALESHNVPTWGLGAVLLGWMAACTAIGVALGAPDHMTWLAVLGVGFIVGGAALYLNLPGHVLVGADGVFVDRRDDVRFVRYGEIAEVVPHVAALPGKSYVGVALELVDGDRLVLPIGDGRTSAARAAQLGERIRAQLAAHRERSGEEVSGAALRRGQRAPEAWLERLRSVGEGANANAREAPVATDKLWRIVENPGADPILRGGAAAALSAHEGSDERLRIVLDDTAEPHLRIALEACIERDERALVEALDVLEERAR